MATSKAAAPLLAYVLHRYDWSETSLIVELYTRSLGRVAVVAKGAKRPTSQLRPVLLPFQPVLALLGKTSADEQQDIRLLRSAEWAGGQALLSAAAMFPGYYLNELLMKLLPRGEAQPALFDLYADTLAALATAPEDSAALRAFELLLLRELGWLPALDQLTLTAAPLQPEAAYTLHEAGALVPGPGPAGITWQAMEQALTHRSASALRTLCRPEAAGLRGPLRRLLHYHLGPAPLRTRQVWQGVQRLALPTPESP